MKILIIPDIHNKWYDAEEIITKENPDKVVFLGDYFDSFGDNLEITYQTATWLRTSMEKENRIHLLGNHDLSYRDPNHMCAGFSQGKLYAINKAGVKLNKLLDYAWVGDYLCTHAGLSYEFYKAYGKPDQPIDDFLQDNGRLYDVSPFRGGQNAFGGIVWCDFDEFVPFPNLKQIFGHTAGDTYRINNGNYCIDTHLNHCAIYENNILKIKKL